jgi:hypothetical protein
VYAFEQSWEQLAAHAHGGGRPARIRKSEYREFLMNPKAMGDCIIRIADAFGLDNPTGSAPTSAPRRRCSLQPHGPAGSAVSSSEVAARRCRSRSPGF